MDDAKPCSGVTFDILLDENVVQPPRRIKEIKNREKEKKVMNVDEIEIKQREAEKRRMAHMRARLKRIQVREELTKKLASNVDLLLQQQFSRRKAIPDRNQPLLSHSEMLETAKQVVRSFKDLQQQLLTTDLQVHEHKHKDLLLPETKWQRALKISANNHHKGTWRDEHEAHKSSGVAFEIPFCDVEQNKKQKKKPEKASLQKKCLMLDREAMAKQQKEKHEKAAQRRQKRQDDKIRHTLEARQALMDLQTKITIFQQYQASLNGEENPTQMSQYDAACLADEIANSFSRMYTRCQADLERAEGFFMVYGKTS